MPQPKGIHRTSLIALACAISHVAHAYADNPKHVDVPAGDLVSALQIFTKQAGAELVFEGEQLRGLRTHGVSGTLTSQQAVTALIAGTPLIVKIDESGAMLITLPRAPVASDQVPRTNAAMSKQAEAVSPPATNNAVPSETVSTSTDSDAAGSSERPMLEEVTVSRTEER